MAGGLKVVITGRRWESQSGGDVATEVLRKFAQLFPDAPVTTNIPADADMVIAWALGRKGTQEAFQKKIPVLLLENPALPGFDFGCWWNGLAGGGWVPPTEGQRPGTTLPALQPPHEGGTLIIGQVPTDSALRKLDYNNWLRLKRKQNPKAEYRPHPGVQRTAEPLAHQLARAGRIITYTSTVGVEALIAGCECRPEHYGSLAYNVDDREKWLERLSWQQWKFKETKQCLDFMMSGYEEAKAQAKRGEFDVCRT